MPYARAVCAFAQACVGEACLQAGDSGRSEVALQRALKLAPEDAKLRTALALAQVGHDPIAMCTWLHLREQHITQCLFRRRARISFAKSKAPTATEFILDCNANDPAYAGSLCCAVDQPRLRRAATAPNRPRPTSASVVGSGTDWTSWKAAVPRAPKNSSDAPPPVSK